ncbi:hypothetical protein [Aquabacterium sp.]|jgi:hypothetical protein|nr:hypothetical protein [Aquabacterium sp.]
MGELMEGAVQQAAQPGRQDMVEDAMPGIVARRPWKEATLIL